MPDDGVPNQAWIHAVKTASTIGKIRAAEVVNRIVHPAQARNVAANGEATLRYLTKALEAARIDGRDDTAFSRTTDAVAIQVTNALGVSAAPGFEISMRNGTRYSFDLAILNPTTPPGKSPIGPSITTVLNRNGKALADTSGFVSGAQAKEILAKENPPANWDSREWRNIAAPDPASMTDRQAFVKEIPDLAATIKAMSLRHGDPRLARAASILQRAVAGAQASGPGL